MQSLEEFLMANGIEPQKNIEEVQDTKIPDYSIPNNGGYLVDADTSRLENGDKIRIQGINAREVSNFDPTTGEYKQGQFGGLLQQQIVHKVMVDQGFDKPVYDVNKKDATDSRYMGDYLNAKGEKLSDYLLGHNLVSPTTFTTKEQYERRDMGLLNQANRKYEEAANRFELAKEGKHTYQDQGDFLYGVKGYAQGTEEVTYDEMGNVVGSNYIEAPPVEEVKAVPVYSNNAQKSAYTFNQPIGGAISQPSIPLPAQQPVQQTQQFVDNPDRIAAIEAVNSSMPEDYANYKGPVMSQSEYYRQKGIALKAVEENNPAKIPAVPSKVATTKTVDVEVPPVVEYSPTPSSSDQSISSRYNNPGNLRFGAVFNSETNKWEDNGKRLDGQISVDPKTGFAIFPNHEAGRKALENQISLDTQTRGMTVEQFINKYAPASDKNDPKAYSNVIAKELGISSSDKITPDQIPKVADIITRVEAGPKGYKPMDVVPPKVEDNKVVPKVVDPTKAITPEASDKVRTYGEAISSTVDSFIKTIKDPDALASAIGGFVKDTLGFNGQDAARFGLLVAGSKALGYNTTQAVRYAGNYTLVSSDKRATATALAKSQMEQLGVKEAGDLKKTMLNKGYTLNSKGEWVPGVTTGSGRQVLTVEYNVPNGPKAGDPIIFNEKKIADGNVIFVDDKGRTPSQVKQLYGQELVPRTEGAHGPQAASVRSQKLSKDLSDSFEEEYSRTLGVNAKANDKPVVDTKKYTREKNNRGTYVYSESPRGLTKAQWEASDAKQSAIPTK